MNIVDVTCAVIIRKGFFLVTQRGEQMSRTGKWEFPGGKVEEGESEEQCILREIREELHIGIRIKQRLTPVVHHYPGISIRLIPFIAEIRSGEIKPEEHSNFKWVQKEELELLDWSPADIPIVRQIIDTPLNLH